MISCKSRGNNESFFAGTVRRSLRSGRRNPTSLKTGFLSLRCDLCCCAWTKGRACVQAWRQEWAWSIEGIVWHSLLGMWLGTWLEKMVKEWVGLDSEGPWMPPQGVWILSCWEWWVSGCIHARYLFLEREQIEQSETKSVILEPISPFSFEVLICSKLFVNVFSDPQHPKHHPQGNVSQLTIDIKSDALSSPKSQPRLYWKILAQPSPQSSALSLGRTLWMREQGQAQRSESRSLRLLPSDQPVVNCFWRIPLGEFTNPLSSTPYPNHVCLEFKSKVMC